MDGTTLTSEGQWILISLIVSALGIVTSIAWNMKIQRHRKYLGHLWSDYRLQKNKEKEFWAGAMLLISSALFFATIDVLFHIKN